MFQLFRKKSVKETIDTSQLTEENIPQHVAIIMDGNGRWAKKRFLPRVAGHKQGMDTVKKITKHASKRGVKVLTLYAFSTENWKRPDDEVNYLMQLPVDFFDTFVPELVAENVKVNVMGYIEYLPDHTKKAVEEAIFDTKNNTGMILNFALNYGSRAEIISAVKSIAADTKLGKVTPEDINEDLISEYLMTAPLKEYQNPDLLIRTSGEERISNFLLWQIAYSELYFTDSLWPDFDERSLDQALLDFAHRNRRFGGLK